jgi:aminoglycoside phosphotransferase (APT) family kinase protein
MPDRGDLIVERAGEGQSTAVYRVRTNGELFYLRILPEVSAGFAPEAFVHSVLRAWRLHVPEVLYVEHFNALLQRSLMLTTAIAGQAIGYGARPSATPQIVRCAGRELAHINSLPVRGFGWVQRATEVVAGLSAEFPSLQEWLVQHFETPLALLDQAQVFSARNGQAIREAMREAIRLFEGEAAVLAHGDFDTTHIYHHQGRYTGIIDFGEIRGAPALYDIGHFWIENSDLLPALLEGYTEVKALPPDHLRRIYLTGLLIAARRLGRRLAKRADPYLPDVQAIRQALRILNT